MGSESRCINGRLFTVYRAVETWGIPSQRLPWALYEHTTRHGYFRLKKDAWRAAEDLAASVDSEATRRAREVEREHALRGAELLDKILLWHGSYPGKPKRET